MNESDEIEITVDPSFLVATALLFPCFADAKAMDDHDNLYEIMMSSYSEDNLTEAQDLVMELIFHLCSPEAQFNLHRAIKVWSHGDIDAFHEIVKEQSAQLQ